MSLDRHINLGWKSLLSRELGEFVDLVPPQQRIDKHWYQGTADAVYQNIYTLEKERPDVCLDLGRRPHLQDELPHAARVSSAERGGFDDRRLARRRGRGEGIRRDAGRHGWPAHRVRGKKALPKDDPRRPAALPGVDGRVCLQRSISFRAIVPRRHAAGQRPRFRAQHHPFADRHASAVCASLSATKTASKTPIGATSARSTPISPRIWT